MESKKEGKSFFNFTDKEKKRIINKANRESTKEMKKIMSKKEKQVNPHIAHGDWKVDKYARITCICGEDPSKWKPKCKTCQGYGMWAIGMYTSMGPMDAGSGLPTLPCPSCGADANPINKNEN